MKKRVSWDVNVIETYVKKPCECQCCYICRKNTKCGVFGKFKCIECNEWRCGLCIKINILMCNNCLKIPIYNI